MQRWRIHGAWADSVAADAAFDVVRRHALGHADHCRLGGAIDKAVWQALMLPQTLAMLMMEPPPLATMRGSAAWITLNGRAH